MMGLMKQNGVVFSVQYARDTNKTTCSLSAGGVCPG